MITKQIIKIENEIKKAQLNDKELIYLFNIVYNNISNKGLISLKI